MRKLSLKKETLVELSGEELDSVVGGAQEITKQTNCYCSDFAPCYPTYRCPTLDCVATVANGC